MYTSYSTWLAPINFWSIAFTARATLFFVHWQFRDTILQIIHPSRITRQSHLVSCKKRSFVLAGSLSSKKTFAIGVIITNCNALDLLLTYSSFLLSRPGRLCSVKFSHAEHIILPPLELVVVHANVHNVRLRSFIDCHYFEIMSPALPVYRKQSSWLQ